jgi:AcrR family transcriptional regulator
MTPRRTDVDGAPLPDGASVARRAPFSDNPTVGARGLRTQQRILDAALRVFDEDGYHRATVERIARRAGCSRISVYQYFSGKEELFRHLAGQVARQLAASSEALDAVTPGAAGWSSLRAWIGRHTDIYERYEPVFHAFDAAAATDEAVAGGAARFSDRNVATIRSRLATTSSSPRQLDATITLVLETVTRAHYVATILRAATPSAFARERVDDALADVVHRTFFGLEPTVNVHPPAESPPPPVRFDLDAWGELAGDGAAREANGPAGTPAALLAAGRDVFVRRGYVGTRIDDLVAAAGVSHGAFYRYFDNKGELARQLAAQAMRTVAAVLTAMPTLATDGAFDRAALRRWLRGYHAAHAGEAAMFRVWVDAMLHDPTLDDDAAPALDWGRRRMARFLQPRRFGDVDTEAVVLLALLEAFGVRDRPPTAVDAASDIIAQGFVGQRAADAPVRTSR